MRNIPFILAVAALSLLAGCGKDCREDARLGEFEFSQGNYARAEKLFSRAWVADSVACADARGRLENARRFLP